jgi:creatinine amidohydrolase
MDVEKYLENEDRIMLVFGTVEQHGYLSLCTDNRIPLAMADAASQKTGVLVAPEMNYGVSPFFLSYPGTVSLRSETFLSVVEDIIRSFYGHGFRKMVIVNGHGGNDLAGSKVTELSNELKDSRFTWYSWWESHSVEALAMKHGLKTAHGNWMEAFQFNRVSELPGGEKIPPHFFGNLNAEQTRKMYGDGQFGGHYFVSDEIMGELFNTCVDDLLQLLKFE